MRIYRVGIMVMGLWCLNAVSVELYSGMGMPALKRDMLCKKNPCHIYKTTVSVNVRQPRFRNSNECTFNSCRYDPYPSGYYCHPYRRWWGGWGYTYPRRRWRGGGWGFGWNAGHRAGIGFNSAYGW